MKVFILTSLLVVAVSASFLEEHVNKFEAFKSQHSKTYKNEVEEVERFTIFSDNLLEIEEHNARYEEGIESYKKAVNQFTDLTQDEFKAYLGLRTKPNLKATQYVKSGVSVSASVDWRSEGQVSTVKNQGECGSCWAFAVAGATEAAYYRKSGHLVSLSAQQLVDCTTNINSGCDGGYLDDTFPYIEQSGIQSDDSYPYTGKDGRCQYDSSQVVTRVSNYVGSWKDEESLLEAVATVGPVAAAIDANYLSSYSSGIFSSTRCSALDLNHGVLVVGYGSENGQNYWIVKNSWGADWGENGFFKLLRGRNECGIAEDNVYPTI